MAESFNHFQELADALPTICAQIVDKTAHDGEGHVKAKIVENGQVVTGNMLNSVHVEDGENPTTKYVVVGAEYAIYPNNGTVHQPARPFFEPGMEAARPGLDGAMAALADALQKGS